MASQSNLIQYLIIGGISFGAGLLVASTVIPESVARRQEELDFFKINTGADVARDQRLCIAAHCPICYEYHNVSLCSECIETHCRSYLGQFSPI